MTHVR